MLLLLLPWIDDLPNFALVVIFRLLGLGDKERGDDSSRGVFAVCNVTSMCMCSCVVKSEKHTIKIGLIIIIG